MALSRVWPDDWMGHALQRILTSYRWIANCGKPKVVQVKVLIEFINNVLAMNATNGRHLKPPATYLKIEEAMSNRIWSRGINRESCQTGRDPYSSTPEGSRIPKREDGYSGTTSSYAPPSKGSGPGGSKKGKGPVPPKGSSNNGKQDFCRGFNSAAGCNMTNGQCRHKHACSRSIDSNRYCNKTDHGADNHP